MIVLNKIDLVTQDELAAVEASVRAINPFAKIHHAQRGNVPIAELLDQGAFDLSRVLAERPDFLDDESHEHNEDVRSMSFEVDGADRPRAVQRLDRRPAGRARRRPAAHQGHPRPMPARTAASPSRPCT